MRVWFAQRLWTQDPNLRVTFKWYLWIQELDFNGRHKARLQEKTRDKNLNSPKAQRLGLSTRQLVFCFPAAAPWRVRTDEPDFRNGHPDSSATRGRAGEDLAAPAH